MPAAPDEPTDRPEPGWATPPGEGWSPVREHPSPPADRPAPPPGGPGTTGPYDEVAWSAVPPPGPYPAAPGAPGAYAGYGVPHGAAPGGSTDVPRWGMGDVAVGVGLYFGAQVVTGVLLVAWLVLTGNLDTGSSADEITDDIGLVSILLGVPLAWVALFGWPWWLSRRKGSGSLARDFGWAFRPIDLATGIGGGVAGIVAAGLAAVSYQAVFGNEAPTNTDIIPSDVPVVTMVLVFLVIAVGTPIAEEMFFRGLFLGAARKAWGTKVGVAVSSIGFGLAHIQPSPVAWLYVGVVTGSYGLVFALLRVWSQGRLAAPIIAHMTVNAVGVVAVFATSP